MASTQGAGLGLTDLAEQTGLSTDVLRLWERRFGFPTGSRSTQGGTTYALWQVRRLRMMRVLIARGERPVQLMAMEDEELVALLDAWQREASQPAPDADTQAVTDCLNLVRRNACDELEARLRSHVIAHGLERFVVRLAAPLCEAVGNAWERGDVAVFQEHLFSAMLERLLRAASSGLFQPDLFVAGRPSPAVLLATVSSEAHLLGLEMVDALLRLNGCHCLNLGASMPLPEIAAAAQVHRSDIVALSFSVAFAPRGARDAILHLRELLEPTTQLWLGGSNPALHEPMPRGCLVIDGLSALGPTVTQWRAAWR